MVSCLLRCVCCSGGSGVLAVACKVSMSSLCGISAGRTFYVWYLVTSLSASSPLDANPSRFGMGGGVGDKGRGRDEA